MTFCFVWPDEILISTLIVEPVFLSVKFVPSKISVYSAENTGVVADLSYSAPFMSIGDCFNFPQLALTLSQFLGPVKKGKV